MTCALLVFYSIAVGLVLSIRDTLCVLYAVVTRLVTLRRVYIVNNLVSYWRHLERETRRSPWHQPFALPRNM